MFKKIVLLFTLALGTHTPLSAHTDGSTETCASRKTRALHDAIYQHNTSEMWHQLSLGASAFEQHFGDNAFDWAVRFGNVKCLTALLRWAKFLGKDCRHFLYGTLHRAAQINRPGTPECLRLLLEFEEETPSKQVTPLFLWWYLLHDTKHWGCDEKIVIVQEFIARNAERAQVVQEYEIRDQQQKTTAQAYRAQREAESTAAAARKKEDEKLLLSGPLKHRIAFFESFGTPK